MNVMFLFKIYTDYYIVNLTKCGEIEKQHYSFIQSMCDYVCNII